MTISFHYLTDFELNQESDYSDWVDRILKSEAFERGEIAFIFCDDGYLLNLNRKFLNHDTLTDIITFDYTSGNTIGGDIYISVQRVKENAMEYDVKVGTELLRVMAHGVLHLMGYDDKADPDKAVMHAKENEKIKLFHVEH